MSLILHSKSKNLSKDSIGGKAYNLHHLEELGFRVPQWLVIPQNQLLNQVQNLDQPDASQLKDLKVSPELLEAIASFFGPDFENGNYAVRSSAIDEDGKQHSFAGQFESYLHVKPAQIAEKIIAVWRSAFSDRVQEYRKQNKLDKQVGIAVIVQRMVNSEVSGVAFGANPISGSLDSKVINAVYGLGEGLVSGALNADNYTLEGSNIEKDICQKTEQFIAQPQSGGVEKVPVAAELQNQSSLSDSELTELAAILDQLASHLKAPQDIEFAIEQGKIYLTQTRPITTLSKPDGEYILWDNSNIIESYPGITTPLTFSFILKMYDQVYRQFVGLMGVPKKKIEQHAEVFANTLGLVRGRVYYNLLNWYKMLAMLPGYSINAENMERMMGVKERFDLKEKFTMNKGRARYRMVLMVLQMLSLQVQLPSRRKRFSKHLNKVISQYKKIDFKQLSADDIIQHYQNFEQDLLLKWKAPLINDFFAMIWFGMLEKQSQQLCPQEPNLHNDLLCGSQDIISVEPIHRSMAIAQMVHDDAAAKELFLKEEPRQIGQRLQSGNYPKLKAKVEEYLSKFGDRCIGELKLESYSYAQKPEQFLKLIKTYVQQGIHLKNQESGIEDEIRNRAEEKVFSALSRKPFKRWWFKFILKMTRDLVSNRENLRFERTRGFGMVRTMMNALGEVWNREGLLPEPRAIFYLKLDEILEPKPERWSQLIQERQEEFDRYRKQEIPKERFYTYGYNFKDEYIYSQEKLEAALDDLKGVGCCPGIVEGQVQVVMDPQELDSLNGKILVTSSTDPGWVTLFPTASAIVVERGSLLSHSAIVSREMGIPCIVGVSGLLRSLKTGDKIKMDGSSGIIKRLENG
jgi:pyruvate,water dikinase